MIDYEIHRLTPTGVPINVFRASDIVSLNYAYGDMSIGACNLVIPAYNYKPLDFEKDQLIEIYRIVDGVKRLEGDRLWRIRNRRQMSNEKDQELIEIVAYDGMYTIDSAVIAYYANSAFTRKTDYADDMLKELVSENMGAGCVLYSDGVTADTDRILSRLSIQADASAAPSISKKMAWQKLKTNLDEICQASREEGTWLTYDLVKSGQGTVEFRTYTGQRGIDFTGANRKVLSKDFRNLLNPVLEFDDESERNYAYVCGEGMNDERTIVTVSDTDRISESPWNRREIIVQASYVSDDTTTDYLTTQGNAALYEKRPKVSLSAEIIETPNFRYGKDFNYGDKMPAVYGGYAFDVRIDKVKVKVSSDNPFEKLTIKVSGEL